MSVSFPVQILKFYHIICHISTYLFHEFD